ncbi:pentapeptide repeat-containing protein, partial [Lactococcus lactis]
MTYANFSGSTLKSVRFLENEAKETFFTACNFKNV